MISAIGTWRRTTRRAHRPQSSKRQVHRGFTLVEVIIAVTIMALASAVMVPAMRNIGRGELRRVGHQLATVMRRTYEDAALSGRTERIVLTMGDSNHAHIVAVEATVDSLLFEGRDGAITRAVEPNAQELESDAEHMALGDEAMPTAEEDNQALAAGGFSLSGAAQSFLGAAHGINQMALRAARPTFTQEGQILLPSGIRVSDVLTEGMAEPARDGSVNLTFFPNGYTQATLVHLKDTDNNMFTVHLESLTGKAWGEEGYVESFDGRSDEP